MTRLLLLLLQLLLVARPSNGAETFGASLKGQGFYCGHEAVVFERLCSAHEAPCAMQHVSRARRARSCACSWHFR